MVWPTVIMFKFPHTKDEVMYTVKVNESHITLQDLTDKCPKRGCLSAFCYFFRMELEEMEVLQEQDDDGAEFPLLKGKVVVRVRLPECKNVWI
jgi:hypothetical protein